VASLFNSVEINGSFYRQIKPSTYEAWRDATPANFRFALKGHRYVTHYLRLANCAEPIDRLRSQAQGLGGKLAVVLWQLPSGFQCDLARLDDFLVSLGRWTTARHAIELRHASWFIPAVAERLVRARVAVCMSDAPDFPLWDAVTTDLVYVRLHGHTRKYASRYSAASLQSWARRARRWASDGASAHVYFDNDAEGAAITDALALAKELGIAGSQDWTRAGGRQDPWTLTGSSRCGPCMSFRRPQVPRSEAEVRRPGRQQRRVTMTRRSNSSKKSKRRYSSGAKKAVGSATRRAKRGTLKAGKGRHGKVKNRKQAIAIGLSEARKKGAKVPRKKG
jgi:uncharacterized protein YecE (DUF72 family)